MYEAQKSIVYYRVLLGDCVVYQIDASRIYDVEVVTPEVQLQEVRNIA